MNEDFQRLLKNSDIVWKSKGNASPNDLSVLDRCIQGLRKDITARMMEEQKTWSQVLNAALVAYNRSIHGTMRDAPADVGKEPVLQFLQISNNAKKCAQRCPGQTESCESERRRRAQKAQEGKGIWGADLRRSGMRSKSWKPFKMACCSKRRTIRV